MSLTPLGIAAMFGWIPVVLLLFGSFPPRRAVLISFIGAWLFLPMAGWDFSGFPDFTKTSATSMGAMLGVLLFDPSRLSKYRFHWLDFPMIVWCIAPFFASLSNNLGAYDGFSESLDQVMRWGIPYFIGRIYFNDLEGLRDLTVGIFIGGLLYVPFCLYEMRFSPQLHRILYGYHQHTFSQAMRDGGFRPMVFMQHGLMVAMWMGMATLAGVWLAWTGVTRRLMGISVWWWVLLLAGTTVRCKSAFALLLTLIGIALLIPLRSMKWQWPVAALAVVPVLYIGMRLTHLLPMDTLLETAEFVTNDDRADSLRIRLEQEELFSQRAFAKPIFGWGGWKRAFPEVKNTQAARAVDSQWVIALGETGLLGLSALTTALFLPVVLLVVRVPGPSWRHPLMAGLVVTALQVTLYAMDNLLNAMINPVFLLGMGGLTGMAAVLRRSMFSAPKVSRVSAVAPRAASTVLSMHSGDDQR